MMMDVWQCLVEQPFPYVSHVKIWNHPIETTISKRKMTCSQEAALEVYRDSLVQFALLGKVGLESNVLSAALQM